MFARDYFRLLPRVTVGWWRTLPVGTTFDVCLQPGHDGITAGPATVALAPLRRTVVKTGPAEARVGDDAPRTLQGGYADEEHFAVTPYVCDTCIEAGVECGQTEKYTVLPLERWPAGAAMYFGHSRDPCALWSCVTDTPVRGYVRTATEYLDDEHLPERWNLHVEHVDYVTHAAVEAMRPGETMDILCDDDGPRVPDEVEGPAAEVLRPLARTLTALGDGRYSVTVTIEPRGHLALLNGKWRMVSVRRLTTEIIRGED